MIVAVPPARVLGVIEEAGEVGVSAAIVATAGMGYGAKARSAIRSGSRRARHGLRLVGPNCIGVLAPRAKTERELRGAQREAGRSRARLAIGRDRGRPGRMGGAAACRLLGRRVARRQGRRRFQRLPRLLRRRSPAPARSCSTSSPSTTRRSSCPRPAPPPA